MTLRRFLACLRKSLSPSTPPAPAPPQLPDRRPDPAHLLSDTLSRLEAQGIRARSLGTRGVIVPLDSAAEVARRLEELAVIETRGCL